MYLSQPGSDPSRTDQVLGAEMGIWSEMNGADPLNIRVWPRAAALAERLWTDPTGLCALYFARIKKNHGSFFWLRRLARF